MVTRRAALGRTVLGVVCTVYGASAVMCISLLASTLRSWRTDEWADVARINGSVAALVVSIGTLLIPAALLLCVPAYQYFYRNIRARGMSSSRAAATSAALTSPVGAIAAALTGIIVFWNVPLALTFGAFGLVADLVIGVPLAWAFGSERRVA